MAKCPECGSEIYHLFNWIKKEVEYRFSIDDNGNEESKFTAYTYMEDGDGEYECPRCQSVLFTEKAMALAFLRGKEA